MIYYILIILVLLCVTIFQQKELGRRKERIFSWRRTAYLNIRNFDSERQKVYNLQNKLDFANSRIKNLNDIINGKEGRKSITLADVYKMTGEAGQ